MSPKTSLCQGIDCRLINAELEFYEQAHCLLDGEPGIDVHVPHAGIPPWEESELEKLGHNPVSEPLRAEYRRAAERLQSIYDRGLIFNRGYYFFEKVKEDDFRGEYDASTFQWETIFVKLLTDPAAPFRFDSIQSVVPYRTPSVWVVRIYLEPVKVIFDSLTDLPIPSPEADRLMAFINAHLEKAGIHLPRKFKIERGIDWSDNSYHRYEIFIPKGECNKPENQDIS